MSSEVIGAGPASDDLARGAELAKRARRFGTWYVAEHQLRRLTRYAPTVISTALGTPLLYLLAFGIGIGSLLIHTRIAVGPGGTAVGYLRFVGPALVAAASLTVASEEFTYPVLLGFKWNPIYFGMNATPLGGRQIINGVVLFVVLRMTLTCGLYYAVLVLFGGVPLGWGVLIVPISVLTGLAFGCLLLAYTTTITEDRGQFAIVMRFIVAPLTLFSGTLFPLGTLPIWLQWIGWISPLWHGTELARDTAYATGEPDWLTVLHVAVLALAALIGWQLSVRFATRRLDR